MPTEADFWGDLRKALPSGHWCRVENPCDPGTPDVNFCLSVGELVNVEGWIELKYTDRLPLEHPVLASQRLWMRRRRRCGGRILIAVGYRAELFFFGSDAANRGINEWLYEDYLDCCLSYARNRHIHLQVQGAFLPAIERLALLG